MRGQIISRGEKTWLIRVALRREPRTGKRRTFNKTFHGTKKDAQQELTRILRLRDTGNFVEPTRITVNDYLDRWLESSVKTRVRPRTYHGYVEYLALYIRPTLGSSYLSGLTPLDVQAAYTALADRGLSARTIRYAHSLLNMALRQAVKWRLLPYNPATDADLPRQAKAELRALSPEQVGQFLKVAKADRLGVLFVLAIATGMRPGEYLGLQWPDVDLEKGAVVVRRTLVPQRGGGWQFGEPKTDRGRRTIPLPPSATRTLVDQRRQQSAERLAAGPKYTDNNLVFATPTGEPLHERNVVNRHFKPLLRAAGLPDSFRLYDLRHTCATLLLAEGEHPKVVSERLGHASITLTLDTYSHVLPTMQQRAADRLEGVLFGKKRVR